MVQVVNAYESCCGEYNVLAKPGSVSIDGSSFKPGTVIGVEHGVYSKLEFLNLHGTADNPILITNLCGQVQMTGTSWVYLRNCQHVHLDGSGTPGVTYGFHFDAILRVHKVSEYIEINNVEMHAARMDIKEDVELDGGDPDFVMTDIRLHHNYCHDHTELNVGMYLGQSTYSDNPGDFLMRNIYVYDNIFVDISGKGIQVGSCTVNCQIYDNLLINCLYTDTEQVRAAIMINEGTACKVFRNIINGCTGPGICGNDGYTTEHEIYNNLLIDCGNGVWNQSAFMTWSDYYSLYNNTIIEALDHGILLDGDAGDTHNEIYNNVILETTNASISANDGTPGASIHDNDTKEDGYTRLNYQFVDQANEDFRLEAGSHGVDNGCDVLGLVTDLNGDPRPVNVKWDIGCYEYQG